MGPGRLSQADFGQERAGLSNKGEQAEMVRDREVAGG